MSGTFSANSVTTALRFADDVVKHAAVGEDDDLHSLLLSITTLTRDLLELGEWVSVVEDAGT